MKAVVRRRNLQSVLTSVAAIVHTDEPGIRIPTQIERSFRAPQAMVFRTAYRITGNAADAEDVLQIVFMRLFRQGEAAEAPENETAYLRRAAINAALDLLRSRHADRSLELPPDLPGNETPELRQELARALGRLQPRPAQIFALRFLEGFTNGQIAEMLGLSQVLVAVIVHRTRQQLRKQLVGYLGDRS